MHSGWGGGKPVSVLGGGRNKHPTVTCRMPNDNVHKYVRTFCAKARSPRLCAGKDQCGGEERRLSRKRHPIALLTHPTLSLLQEERQPLLLATSVAA